MASLSHYYLWFLYPPINTGGDGKRVSFIPLTLSKRSLRFTDSRSSMKNTLWQWCPDACTSYQEMHAKFENKFDLSRWIQYKLHVVIPDWYPCVERDLQIHYQRRDGRQAIFKKHRLNNLNRRHAIGNSLLVVSTMVIVRYWFDNDMRVAYYYTMTSDERSIEDIPQFIINQRCRTGNVLVVVPTSLYVEWHGNRYAGLFDLAWLFISIWITGNERSTGVSII